MGIVIPTLEWDFYWQMPLMEAEPDMTEFWKPMQPHMPALAKITLLALLVLHKGLDTQRNLSYYKLCRTDRGQGKRETPQP